MPNEAARNREFFRITTNDDDSADVCSKSVSNDLLKMKFCHSKLKTKYFFEIEILDLKILRNN